MGGAYLPDHAVPHASNSLAMLAVGHQVQVVGELDHLGQLLEDVNAEALTTELGVGGCVAAAEPPRDHRSQNPLSPQPQPNMQTLPQSPCMELSTVAPHHTRPKSLVALPAAGYGVGYTATSARVRALHNDKGPLFQCGHCQVPAVHYGLQRGTVSRPHWVLHIEDTMIPATYLQRTGSLSLEPLALLSPASRCRLPGARILPVT